MLEPIPTTAQAEKALAFFAKAKLDAPVNLVGIQSGDLVEGGDIVWPKDPHVKAVIRRSLNLVNDLDVEVRAAKTSAATSAVAASSAQPQICGILPPLSQEVAVPGVRQGMTYDQEQRLAMLGADPSGVAMTTAMRASKSKVNMVDQLRKAKLENLPHQLRAPLKVWQLMEDHTTLCIDEGRKHKFLYVELTKLLPRWMSVESVGGKATVVAESFCMPSDPSLTTMGQMFTAMKTAYGVPQWFRTPTQWFVVFMTQYVPLATASEHMTWERVHMHVDRMSRMFEEARTENETLHAVLLYDRLLRKRLHELVEQNDPDVDPAKFFAEKQKEIWLDAQCKVQIALAEVGLSAGSSPTQQTYGQPAQSNHDTAVDRRVLAQATHVAEKAAKRAEDATRQLEQNRKLERDKNNTLLEDADLQDALAGMSSKEKRSYLFKRSKELMKGGAPPPPPPPPGLKAGGGKGGGKGVRLKPAPHWKKRRNE